MKKQKTKDECLLVPWSEALMQQLAEHPLTEQEKQKVRQDAEETVRKVVEAVEHRRLWIKENLDEPRLPNGTPIEEFTEEAERQWDMIRDFHDPMAIDLVLNGEVFEERLEDRRGPALREAESRTTGAHLAGLIDDFIRIHREFLNEEREGVDRGAEAAFLEALTRLKGHAGTPNDPKKLKRAAPKSRAWCHDAPPEKDSFFIRGPITGNQKEIEAALDMRWPTIQQKQDATFYVVEVKKGKYTVYFRHQADVAEASIRLEDFRTRNNAQQQAGTRKLSKKKEPK